MSDATDELWTFSGKRWLPEEWAVCMGLDAFRIATGQAPKNFTDAQVRRWLHIMSKQRGSHDRP